MLDVDPLLRPAPCCPCIELQLKAILFGDGGKFLVSQPDRLSVHKTRSLSWLAQFITQIVTVLHWEDQFKTEGIDSLTEWKSVIEEACDCPGECDY